MLTSLLTCAPDSARPARLDSTHSDAARRVFYARQSEGVDVTQRTKAQGVFDADRRDSMHFNASAGHATLSRLATARPEKAPANTVGRKVPEPRPHHKHTQKYACTQVQVPLAQQRQRENNAEPRTTKRWTQRDAPKQLNANSPPAQEHEDAPRRDTSARASKQRSKHVTHQKRFSSSGGDTMGINSSPMHASSPRLSTSLTMAAPCE